MTPLIRVECAEMAQGIRCRPAVGDLPRRHCGIAERSGDRHAIADALGQADALSVGRERFGGSLRDRVEIPEAIEGRRLESEVADLSRRAKATLQVSLRGLRWPD